MKTGKSYESCNCVQKLLMYFFPMNHHSTRCRDFKHQIYIRRLHISIDKKCFRKKPTKINKLYYPKLTFLLNYSLYYKNHNNKNIFNTNNNSNFSSSDNKNYYYRSSNYNLIGRPIRQNIWKYWFV